MNRLIIATADLIIANLHDELMSARDERQVVRVVESLRNVLAESITGATRRDAPAGAIVGVGP